MKKFLTILLALAMVFSMAGVVSADDVTGETQASEGTTEETQTTPTVPLQPADKTDGMDLEYDLVSTYVLKIPSDVSFNENLEHTGEVSLSNVLLPAKSMLTVTVNSLHDFNLQNGADTDFIVSRIPYSVIKDNGNAVTANDNVVLVVSEGVSENAEKLIFKTEGKGATLSGKHTDRLTFNAHWSVNPNAETEITIGSLEQLKKFRDSVNAGNGYEGTTVKLTADIDLGNEEWTPIGSSSNTFNGIFDGQGNTISNVNVDGTNYVGLFGSLKADGNGAEIKNLIVKDATIVGNHYGGVIAGSGGSGKITNCQVYDSTVTLTPVESNGKFNDGDKAGGIIGFMSDDAVSVSGCLVSNVVITGYRDIGGIVGCCTDAEVTGNTVKDSILILTPGDKSDSGEYEFESSYKDNTVSSNVGEIVGRTVGDVTQSGNTHKNVDIWNPKEDTFTVSSVTAINEFAADVNSGNTYEGKTIKLTSDLDLYCEDTSESADGDPVTFRPIGDKSSNGVFKGTFDGQGHTIENLYQNGWDLGYEWGVYGSYGLFGIIENATIKNVKISGAESYIEGGDVGGITGSASGTCVFENIEIKDSVFATYNNGNGGIIGWSGDGTYTFKNIKIGEDVVLGGLWGSFDSSIGGVVGQGENGATYNFENVEINCRLDAYNDCTASYDYYNYRMCGMIIGRLAETTTIDGANYPDTSKYNIQCTNVVVNYGDWMNYHYCRAEGARAVRVEAGYAYDGIAADYDHSQCTAHHMDVIPFDQIFGGDQYGVKGLKTYGGVTVNYPESYNPEN